MPGRLQATTKDSPIVLPSKQTTHKTSIHDIPPEVLGQIFAACLDDCNLDCIQGEFQPYNDRLVPNITPNSAPLVLFGVSREWRKISLGTPKLFTRLFLHGRITVDPTVIVPMWLEHSGCLPLDVVIQPEIWYSPTLTNSTKGAVVRPILVQLHQNYHRIRTLRCGALLDEFFPNVPPIIMTALQEFTLTPASPLYRPSKGSYTFGAVTAPNLELFQIMPGAHYHHALEFVGWGDRLRVFRNEGLFQSLSELVDIILQAPNLEVCILRMGARTTGSGRDWDDIFIRLPRLRNLTLSPIGSDEFQDLCPFLGCLEIPALEEFDVQNNIDTVGRHLPAQDFKTTFHSLFPDPSSNLRILRLHWFDMDAIDLVSLLPKFNQLNELAIEWANCDSIVFQVLARPEVCPKLTSLALAFVQVIGLGLPDMLVSRLTPSKSRLSLQEVGIYHCKGIGDEEQRAISLMSQKYNHTQWYISDT